MSKNQKIIWTICLCIITVAIATRTFLPSSRGSANPTRLVAEPYFHSYEEMQVQPGGNPSISVRSLIGFFLGVIMKQIDISTKKYPNTFALVDDEDYVELSKHKWCCGGRGYATRSRPRHDGIGVLYMHRVILKTPDGMDSDHKNGDRLDNRRFNLRICTRTQNQQNRGKHKTKASEFKGVDWQKHIKKWRARIRIDGKLTYLGLFIRPVVAAKAYDEAAKKHFGEFALTNF